MGEKHVTRTDVALKAGVSESTVSRALSDSPLISDPVKSRVRKITEELGYVPNRQAALLAQRRTYRIGLVVRTYRSFTPFSRAYFPRLLDGVLQRAEENEYSVTIILDARDGSPKDLSVPIRSKEVDGLLFAVTPIKDSRFSELRKQNVPFVLVNNSIPGLFCVDCDVDPGMRDAFAHARELGHESITYIAGDQDYWDGRHRLEIFRKLAAEYGMTQQVMDGNFSMTSGRRAAAEVLDSTNPPTMIMCASDRAALGVLDYCREQGISIPGDLSVIGFDNLGPARDSVPGLTTINNPVSRMGNTATTMLIDRLEGRKTDTLVRVDSEFIQRDSTGPPPLRAIRKPKIRQKEGA